MAAYFDPKGHYAVTIHGLKSSISNGPLTAIGNSTSADGVYKYTSSATFPSNNYEADNWYVDVKFVPSPAGAAITTSPTVTKTTPATTSTTPSTTTTTPATTSTTPNNHTTTTTTTTTPSGDCFASPGSCGYPDPSYAWNSAARGSAEAAESAHQRDDGDGVLVAHLLRAASRRAATDRSSRT